MKRDLRLLMAASYVLAPILYACAPTTAQVRRTDEKQATAQQRRQAAEQMKVGKFIGRSAPKRMMGAPSPGWHPPTLSELKAVVPQLTAVPPYADLNPGSLVAPGRAHIRFEYNPESTYDPYVKLYLDIEKPILMFHGQKGVFTLNIKRSAPGKVYVAACGVYSNAGEFIVEGGGHTETWRNESYRITSIVLNIIPANDEWYAVTITNTGSDFYFYGCRILEY